MEIYIYLVLGGILGGVLAGLIGIGGGIIYVFLLEIFLPQFGIDPTELASFIIANSIFAVFFASFSSNVALIRRKEFYYKEVLLVGIPAIVISLASLYFIVNTDWFTPNKFNVVIILLLLYMLYKTIRKANQSSQNQSLEKVPKAYFAISGCAGGLVASVSGLGGGVVMVPLMNGFIGLNIKVARSISLGVISITAFCMTCLNLLEKTESFVQSTSQGLIVFPLAIGISVGVILGGPIGVQLSSKLSNKTVSVIYILFLLLFIVKKIFDLYFQS